MKKIILLGAFLLAFSAQAQENVAFKNDAIKLMKATGTGASFDGAITQIGTAVGVAQDKNDKYTAEANGTLKGLYEKMADLYITEFTHDEVKELLKFYDSDLGKKMASKQLLITQKSMALGRNWGMEVQGIAQKYMGTINATPTNN
jgi:hypothetical protein